MANAYQMTDNPLITSGGTASTDEIRRRATPIYTRLSAFEAFAPITATAVSDWSVQAGDMVKIHTDEGELSLPIFTQKIKWNGGATSVYESTGNETRPVKDIEMRKASSYESQFGSLRRGVGGLRSDLEEAEGLIIENQNSILLKVDKDGIISAINMTPESITIQSKRINLEGYVTASEMRTEISTAVNAFASKFVTTELWAARDFYFKGYQMSLKSKEVVTSLKTTNKWVTTQVKTDDNGLVTSNKSEYMTLATGANTEEIYYMGYW